MKTVRIAVDFSRTPGARYRTDGPFSGEQFREEVLMPLLKDNESIIVDLDGTRGFATSFLEEAFGGLARKIGVKTCLSRLTFVSREDDTLQEEIIGYIKAAT
jgi:hypothetical protein